MTSVRTKLLPDTVRSRKTGGLSASTQRFLSIAEIRSNVILLKNGGLRAVLEIEPINYNLKSETEQKAIIAGYGGFVNTLNFPLQIVVRSTKTNIDEYLTTLRALGGRQENALLKEQTFAYANFMQQLVSVADIMQKRFLIVVPADHSPRHRTLIEQFWGWLRPDDNRGNAIQRGKDFNVHQRQLGERVELVASGLQNVGLRTRRLNTRELIELFYQIYNPKTSRIQKFPKDEELLQFEKTVL